MSLATRQLGRSSLSIAPLAFGGNVFGWSVDEAQSFALLDAFVEAGFNLLDTADVYSAWAPGNQGGESETIIGRWLRQSGKRDKVLIATKVGLWGEHPGLSPMNIRQAVEGSLRRLQTDYIDLYQAHQDDASVPLHETLGTFAQLIEEGKVRVIGASNYQVDRLAEALKIAQEHGFPRYESLQPEYNLLDRAGYEAELEPLVRQEQLGVISYYSLASGFLSGKYRSEADLAKSRTRGERVKKYLNPRGLGVLDGLDAIAQTHRASPSQVALAWLIAKPSLTAPIVSATSPEQLQELVGAAELRLSAEEIATLNQLSA